MRPRRSSRKWWKSMLALPWLRKSARRCLLLSAVCGIKFCKFIRNASNKVFIVMARALWCAPLSKLGGNHGTADEYLDVLQRRLRNMVDIL